MTEEEYAQLNAHPSPDFIAMNLHQRMDAAQQSAVEAAERAQLEAQLQRQNEISGSSRPTAARSTGPQASRTPKALEFPNCPANLIYRGSTDGRQVQDWVREWDALSLYVHPDYKVAHLLTAIAEPVKQTLSAAFRTTAYNGGTGYATLTHVPYNEIIDLMKTNFDRPDYVYRAVVRWRDHKMNSSTTLEAYLRERDKLCNQLSSYGIIVDAVTSKYMLVAAVTPEHRKEMMREKDWQTLTEAEIVHSRKTKERAVSTANAGGGGGGRQNNWQPSHPPHRAHMNVMRQHHLMVAGANVSRPAQQTPGGNVNNAGTRGARPKAHQRFDIGHFAYATRQTPRPWQQRTNHRPYSAPAAGGGGINRTANTVQRNRSYNLRQQDPAKLGQRHMRQYYHPSTWSARIDPATNRLRSNAEPWKPANAHLFNKDQDQTGAKYCIFCKTQGHNLTTCSAAHTAWKQRRQGQ